MADKKLKENLNNILEPIDNASVKFHLNHDQIQLIEEARASVRKTGVSNQEVFSKTKEWLNK